MESANSNIRVFVRVRPLSAQEHKNRTVCNVVDEHVLAFDPKDVNANKDTLFAFDRVFSENAMSSEVFEHTTKDLVTEVLNGFNCTCFAYGPTGSGKTYTMIGNATAPGVMVQTMHELFERMRAEKDERIYDVKISYLEVYNETIRDLLVPNPKNLDLRDSEGKDVVVAGLSFHAPKSADEVLTLLEEGNLRRSQSATDANSQSSRSHAIFQVTVHSKSRTGNVSTAVRTAKLSLVDLAGSERAAKTNNRGARLVEGANINKSLLALGNCINALSKSSGNQRVYVPYRNSKLTRLLKDSLCGNCKTVMIANVSPSILSIEDTHNTLQYANRAKNIRTNRNEVNVKYHVSQYRSIINELRQEVTDLKTRNANHQVLESSLVQELKQKRQVLVKDRIDLTTAIEEVIAAEDTVISNSDLDEKSISDLRELAQTKRDLIQALRDIGTRSRNLRYQAEREYPKSVEKDLVLRDLDIDGLELLKLETDLQAKDKEISIKKLTVRCLQLTGMLREKEAIIQDQQAILKEHSLLPADMAEITDNDPNSEVQSKSSHVDTDLFFAVIDNDTEETYQNNYDENDKEDDEDVTTSPTSAKLLLLTPTHVKRRQTMPTPTFSTSTPRQARFASPDSIVKTLQSPHYAPVLTTPKATRSILRTSNQPQHQQRPQYQQLPYKQQLQRIPQQQLQYQQQYQQRPLQRQSYDPPPRTFIPQTPKVIPTPQRLGHLRRRTEYYSPAPKKPAGKRMVYVPKYQCAEDTEKNLANYSLGK